MQLNFVATAPPATNPALFPEQPTADSSRVEEAATGSRAAGNRPGKNSRPFEDLLMDFPQATMPAVITQDWIGSEAEETLHPGAQECRGKNVELPHPTNRQDGPTEDPATIPTASQRADAIGAPTNPQTVQPDGDAIPLITLVREAVGQALLSFRDGRTECFLRLEPLLLGSIRVHLTASMDSVTARLVVDQETTRQLIESRLDDLLRALTAAGVSLFRVEILGEENRESLAREQNDEGSPWQALSGCPRGPLSSFPRFVPILTTSRVDLFV